MSVTAPVCVDFNRSSAYVLINAVHASVAWHTITCNAQDEACCAVCSLQHTLGDEQEPTEHRKSPCESLGKAGLTVHKQHEGIEDPRH